MLTAHSRFSHLVSVTLCAALISLLLLAIPFAPRASAPEPGSTGESMERAAAPGPAAAPTQNPLLAFSSGACHAFAPTGTDQHRTVFIDAGHGGIDPGTAGSALISEKAATLAVSHDLQQSLTQDGYRVVLSRTEDTTVTQLTPADLKRGAMTVEANHRDLLSRIACANSSGVDLLLSVHFNAFDDSSIGGTQTFYDAARPFALANQRFAGLVQQDVVAALAQAGWQRPDRGIATDASDDAPALSAESAAYPYLVELGPAAGGWVDEPSRMPGALCEPLFLSNPTEAAIAASAAGQQAIAAGLAQAVEEYFWANDTGNPTGYR